MHQDYQPYPDNFVDSSQAVYYVIPELPTMNYERKSTVSAGEEELKRPDYMQGIITQEQIDKLIEENESKFAELKLSKRDLIQLVSHPVTLTSQNKKAQNAEEYHLLHKTMQAFFELVQTTTPTQMKTIKLCSV